MPASTPGLLTVDKVPGIVRTRFTLDTKVSFPAGGIADQKPIINLLMSGYSATEYLDSYFDIGATDVAKDLDVINPTTMKILYQDPAFIDGKLAATGALAPKAVMLRCLVGSGLVYLNAMPDLSAPSAKFHAPLTLHAGAGIFYYTFPHSTPRHSRAIMPGVVPTPVTVALALLTIHLRTFEEANRFQLVLFK